MVGWMVEGDDEDQWLWFADGIRLVISWDFSGRNFPISVTKLAGKMAAGVSKEVLRNRRTVLVLYTDCGQVSSDIALLSRRRNGYEK